MYIDAMEVTEIEDRIEVDQHLDCALSSVEPIPTAGPYRISKAVFHIASNDDRLFDGIDLIN